MLTLNAVLEISMPKGQETTLVGRIKWDSQIMADVDRLLQFGGRHERRIRERPY